MKLQTGKQYRKSIKPLASYSKKFYTIHKSLKIRTKSIKGKINKR